MTIEPYYIELIKSGEPVAFPTETVYGLGADAFNTKAIEKVFKAKGRPSDNPLIVHISDPVQINDFAKEIPESVNILIQEFWPGPLTLVLKKKPIVLDKITAGLNTVALRMPKHKLALDLIAKTGPLVAPSANKSGQPSPTKANHVFEDFGDTVSIIDGGTTEVGLESTVLDVSRPSPMILRPGSISKEEIEAVLGSTVLIDDSEKAKPKSPGQKYSHYKPKAEVRWLNPKDDLRDPSTLFLLINGNKKQNNIINYDQEFDRLARELYDRFRQADIEKYKTVVIEPFDERNNVAIIPALLNRIGKAIS